MKKEIFDKYASLVADQFFIKLEDMYSKSRVHPHPEARQMLYYLAYERPIKISSIRRFMEENGLPVQHNTIMKGYKNAKKLVDSDEDYKDFIKKIGHNVQ
jgi:chromosomal replication initiation ATPase DnaA|tara:strand:+ start:638 stop:937 length:300 start_codon:yes stop_codon:yes gene_type:complete